MSHVDYTLFKTINGWSGSSFADRVLTALAKDLPAVMVVLVAVVFLVRWPERRQERRAGAVLATAAAGLALLINQPIAHAVHRLRPYLAHPAHAHLLIARSPDPSFPSDHATGAFALAFAVWLYDRTIGTILLALGALLAFARVYVGTHYPSDVAAGAVIGIAVAAALFAVPVTRRLVEQIATLIGGLWDAAFTALSRRAHTSP